MERINQQRQRELNQEAAMAQIHMNEAQRKLKQEIFVQKVKRNNDLVISDLKLKLQERGQTNEINQMMNRIDKSDYEAHHPCPEFLKDPIKNSHNSIIWTLPIIDL